EGVDLLGGVDADVLARRLEPADLVELEQHEALADAHREAGQVVRTGRELGEGAAGPRGGGAWFSDVDVLRVEGVLRIVRHFWLYSRSRERLPAGGQLTRGFEWGGGEFPSLPAGRRASGQKNETPPGHPGGGMEAQPSVGSAEADAEAEAVD